ncbi:MAG: UDP-N-acetylmuramate dehydrogenase [Clostridia bacterium]|nr:UDP-N-acetylmuramate dehydrogenase [Clostridia bacterium]
MFREFECLENVELKNFSTIKIGGKIDYIVFPKNHIELLNVLERIKTNNLRWFVLGNGSNILFSDNGFRGVAVSLKHFNKVVRIDDSVWCGAGINAFALNNKLLKLGLSGVEWSYGIPATLGGMVVNNAGCFGNEVGEYVEEVLIVGNEKLRVVKREDLLFDYRSAKLGNVDLKKYVVLAIKLQLFQEKSEIIAKNMQNYLKKKRENQPCDKLSLGSVFKRICAKEVIFPAKFIDELGLKGMKIGGAEISEKHSGFIINLGNATADDVLKLIALIERKLAMIKVFPEREIEVFV